MMSKMTKMLGHTSYMMKGLLMPSRPNDFIIITTGSAQSCNAFVKDTTRTDYTTRTAQDQMLVSICTAVCGINGSGQGLGKLLSRCQKPIISGTKVCDP